MQVYILKQGKKKIKLSQDLNATLEKKSLKSQTWQRSGESKLNSQSKNRKCGGTATNTQVPQLVSMEVEDS